MSDYDVHAEESIQAAPVPTPGVLKRRRNFFYQVIRFAAINLKMMRVILKGHH